MMNSNKPSLFNKDLLVETYRFIEENFEDTPLQYYGFYFLEKFNDLKTGNVKGVIDNNRKYSFFKARAKSLKEYNMQLSGLKNPTNNNLIRLDIYFDRGVDTPYFLAANKGDNIRFERMNSLDMFLKNEISEIESYIKNKVEQNHLLKQF